MSAYRIGRYPVTVAEYREFIEHDGYEDEEHWAGGGFGQFEEPDGWQEQLQHPNRPVVGVSWYEAAAYAAWAKCRLPTEAEWERAARGGSDDGRKYPWGDAAPDPTRMNYATGDPDDYQTGSPTSASPTPVGIYPLGLSPEGVADMAGNVWEWCADWFGNYASDPVEDPTGPSEGNGRVLRGGSWHNPARDCRVSCRVVFGAANRNGDAGFRVVGVVVLGGQDS